MREFVKSKLNPKQIDGIRRVKNSLYRKWRRAYFHTFCFFNNLLPNYNVDPELELRDFICQDLDKHWPKLHRGSSPGRKLSDLFWYSLPHKDIISALGSIRAMDIGCGPGGYGLRLKSSFSGQLQSYMGLDVYEHENWIKVRQVEPDFKFRVYDGDRMTPYIPVGTNFFMSQSAIEHFEDDFGFFREIKDYIDSYAQPVMQIHVFPSKACHKLYGYHGHRQYTPRTVSKITRLFKDSQKIFYNLGDQVCNDLHYNFITAPLKRKNIDMRFERLEDYNQYSYQAIKSDIASKSSQPSYHALVICSNFGDVIF